MTLYDAHNKRLAVFERQATPEFWDAQWNKDELLKRIKSGNTYHFLKKITQRYVPQGGRILEGGCGTGQVVYALGTCGYEVSGVDFAPATVEMVKSLVPDLCINLGDVRHLDFPDASFDGYWSLGVIEHFWDGYDEIVQEAHRVLKPGGTLFLTFPWMSPLRRLKARLGRYQKLAGTQSTDTFYEFMLDDQRVQKQLESQGFVCMESYHYDALKGLKDELPFLHAPLQHLYKSRSKLARGVRYLLTLLLSKFTGHMILLVCRKSSVPVALDSHG